MTVTHLISPHLISSQLIIISTECAVIGCRQGVLDRALWSYPIRCGCDHYSALNSDEI